MDDIMVIVSRTNFDVNNDEHWASIWEGYTQGGWSSAEWSRFVQYEAEFRAICRELVSRGLLHQPRLFGAHPPRATYPWYETIVEPRELDRNPAVKEAWDQYQILSGLSRP